MENTAKCTVCGNSHWLRDEDAGSQREVERKCMDCYMTGRTIAPYIFNFDPEKHIHNMKECDFKEDEIKEYRDELGYVKCAIRDGQTYVLEIMTNDFAK